MTEQAQHTRPGLVDAYVAAVAEGLADLPEGDRAGLLDDLREHAAARLAEQPAADLVAVLGRPEDYALELRTAAGLPPAARPGRAGPGPAGGSWAERLRVLPAVGAAARLPGRLRGRPGWAWAAETVRALVPAWWVARAWLLLAALTVLVLLRPEALPGIPPLVAGVPGSGTAVLVLLVLASVRLGLAARRRPAGLARAASVGVDLAAVALVLLALPSARHAAAERADEVSWTYVQETSGSPAPDGLALDGDPVTDVLAYDLQGDPLGVVQLRDQDGRPVRLSTPERSDGLRVVDVPVRDATGAVVAVTPARRVLVDPDTDEVVAHLPAPGLVLPGGLTPDPLPPVGTTLDPFADEDDPFAGATPPRATAPAGTAPAAPGPTPTGPAGTAPPAAAPASAAPTSPAPAPATAPASAAPRPTAAPSPSAAHATTPGASAPVPVPAAP